MAENRKPVTGRMRRLATQKRGGSVKSQGDYQTISELEKPLCFVPRNPGRAVVTVQYEHSQGQGRFASVGGYLAADRQVSVDLTVTDEGGRTFASRTLSVDGQNYWTRAGIAWEESVALPVHLQVTLSWQGPARLTVWGLDCNQIDLPEPALRYLETKGRILDRLNSIHLAPEAFYMSHDSPLCGGLIVHHQELEWGEGDRQVLVKKCSQCQRLLPIDPRLGLLRAESSGRSRSPGNMVLAFHGHRSKRTGYQNECRACKKFEINDHFNILRSWDQLHESSVLTRERKILLRESEVLAQFKERHSKQGLRSFVWNRFRRRCFYCERPVSLRKYQLDHTRPLAYLWPLDEYATCLCAECNNNKKDKFPVEFYSPTQLEELSKRIGLPLGELKARSVNPLELTRIRGDIVAFAASWTPRLFCSVALRVKDIDEDIDLFDDLRRASPERHDEIVAYLRTRPSGILDLGDEGD